MSRSKVRLSATPTVLRRLIDHQGQYDDPIAFEQQPAVAVIQQELGHPTMAPRLTTWYRRAALSAESGRIRITLDERLTFCRPQPAGVVGAEVAPTRATSSPRDLRASRDQAPGPRPAWLRAR